MKIVCLANSIVNANARSGGDIIFMEFAKRLPEDVKITVVTSEAGHSQWRQEVARPITYEVVKNSGFERALNPLTISLAYARRSLAAAGFLSRILREGESALVYSSSDFICDVWPAVWAKMRRKKMVWSARVYHIIPAPGKRDGSFLSNAISFLAQRLSLWFIRRYADMVFSLNEPLTQELISLGVSRDLIVHGGAGIDLQRVRNAPCLTPRVHFDGVFFGRIMPQKGIYDCIDIWEKVVARLPGARLAIVGGGTSQEMEKVKAEIVSRGLEKNVTFYGYVASADEVYGVLKAAKVYLFCDHENGWGISVAEGMAAGLPVVAFALPIFGTVHKKGFIAVPCKDIERFAKEVLSLLEDEPSRKALALQASQQAETYDWHYVTDEFVAALKMKGAW